MFRLFAGSERSDFFLYRMSPESGVRNPAMQWSMVDLPAPLFPSKVSIVPSGTSKSQCKEKSPCRNIR